MKPSGYNTTCPAERSSGAEPCGHWAVHRVAPPCHRRCPSVHARCRGGVYLAVLGASMIVTILGVAGLYAARVQGRISSDANDSMRAIAAVSSAVELGRLKIKTDAGWRTRYSNNTWTSSVDFAGARLSFKLIDEADGNLADNATQSVRLHGRAIIGKAVRIESVELVPDGGGNMIPTSGSRRQEVLP